MYVRDTCLIFLDKSEDNFSQTYLYKCLVQLISATSEIMVQSDPTLMPFSGEFAVGCNRDRWIILNVSIAAGDLSRDIEDDERFLYRQ